MAGRPIGSSGRTAKKVVGDSITSGIMVSPVRCFTPIFDDGKLAGSPDRLPSAAYGFPPTSPLRQERFAFLTGIDVRQPFSKPSLTEVPPVTAAELVRADTTLAACITARPGGRITAKRPVARVQPACKPSVHSTDPYNLSSRLTQRNWHSRPKRTDRRLDFGGRLTERFPKLPQKACKQAMVGPDPYKALQCQDFWTQCSRRACIQPQQSSARMHLFSRGGLRAGGTFHSRLEMERVFNKDFSRFGL